MYVALCRSLVILAAAFVVVDMPVTLLAQANDALRSIRALSDLLARHPEALIKGRPAGPLE